MIPFAAYIPIGPDKIEVVRAVDLIHSLLRYEPSIPWIVAVDDSRVDRNLEHRFHVPPTCKLIILLHPRQYGSRNANGGAVCVANIVAFDYIWKHLDADFVVKLDTDALIIAPFAQKIAMKFRQHYNAGMLGVLGDSCNRKVRSFLGEREVMGKIKGALTIARNINNPDAIAQLIDRQIKTPEQIRNFVAVCQQISTVMETDFKGEHCQGGAYAVSREMINQLVSRGMLNNPLSWLDIPLAEDVMMGIFCAIVGLKPVDFSDCNEPFGIQSVGIAYAPETLLQRGYSIIHSVKGSPQYGEVAIRQYFREERVGETLTKDHNQ